MDKITVGVLTVSDRCSRDQAIDESGPCLIKMIDGGIVLNAAVSKVALVPDSIEEIQQVLLKWCDEETHLILTTGGTGISNTDVTPEATAEVVKKTLSGISNLMFKRSSQITPLAALSRGIAGVRGKTLIINLPGSKKASKECLEAIACVIPHAVDLINDKKKEIEQVHVSLGEKKSLVVPCNPAERKRASEYLCVSVSEAQKIVTERPFLLMKKKTVSYKEALGYVLAQDVSAWDNLPPFDASLKDGYAVLSSDRSCRKKMVGVSSAGKPLLDVQVLPGCCVRISTGAAVPPGADAVVQVENTAVSSVSEDNIEETEITFKQLADRGQDIRTLGSDFKLGEMILEAKTYLDPAAVGVLAAAGQTYVEVFDKPRVGVLSTGDEVVNPEEELPPGKVRDTNRITLISLLRDENFEAMDLGIAPDEPEALRKSLERGFRKHDVIVTTGSMSMGERDYLKEVLLTDFDAEICFGRVLMKPGKPTSFGFVKYQGNYKLWFGLPGNPASALVTSHLFLLPALRKISGYKEVFPVSITATLVERIFVEDRPQFVRGVVRYNNEMNLWFASFTGNQSSSRIQSCVNANCLLEIPRGKPLTFLEKNSTVTAILIGKFL